MIASPWLVMHDCCMLIVVGDDLGAYHNYTRCLYSVSVFSVFLFYFGFLDPPTDSTHHTIRILTYRSI